MNRNTAKNLSAAQIRSLEWNDPRLGALMSDDIAKIESWLEQVKPHREGLRIALKTMRSVGVQNVAVTADQLKKLEGEISDFTNQLCELRAMLAKWIKDNAQSGALH